MQDFQQGLKGASQGEVVITKAKETGEVSGAVLQNFQEPVHWKVIYVIDNTTPAHNKCRCSKTSSYLRIWLDMVVSEHVY